MDDFEKSYADLLRESKLRLPERFRRPWVRIVSAVWRFGEKLATFGAGVAIKKTLDYGFDYALYPVALAYRRRYRPFGQRAVVLVEAMRHRPCSGLGGNL